MGKKVIFSDVDFTENAIPIAKAVEGTICPQYVYAANVVTPPQNFDWDSHKIEIQVKSDGSILSFNIPEDIIAIPRFACGGNEENSWLEEIDLTYLSALPLSSLNAALTRCTALERVILGGIFTSLTGTNAVKSMFYNSLVSEIIIDSSFNAPNLADLTQMFYASGVKKVNGLKNLIKSSVTSLQLLFTNCTALEEVELSGCNTINVTTFSRMFDGCTSLANIKGINSLDTRNVTDFSKMFSGVGQLGKLDISNWTIKANANTSNMFLSTSIYEINANCFTALYGDIKGMFYAVNWNTIHLDHLNDISAVTDSTNLFSSYVIGTPKVTIANVTNSEVKTLLINALNTRSVGGSSDWHEDTVDGVLCLVP